MSDSIIILGDTGVELNVTGQKFKGDGFFGFADGQHTVGFYLNQFVGRVWIEAALAEEPTSGDWFMVTFEGESNPYLQFDNPTTSLEVRNFTGNFVWVRAVVSRSHISPSPQPQDVGKVRQVLLNH